MRSQGEIDGFAKRMRRRPTRHEKIFADRLKRMGVDFKQQEPFGGFILDFLIPSKLLVFEIDGQDHRRKWKYDRMRDDFCKRYGITVIRIRNEAVETCPIAYFLQQHRSRQRGRFKWNRIKAGSRERRERFDTQHHSLDEEIRGLEADFQHRIGEI